MSWKDVSTKTKSGLITISVYDDRYDPPTNPSRTTTSNGGPDYAPSFERKTPIYYRWEKRKVTDSELLELARKGIAIKINC